MMNLYALGLSPYQRDMVNYGKVKLRFQPGPCWFATHRDGLEVFAKSAREAMDALEVGLLEQQFHLEPHVEDNDMDNEFNDEGMDPGDLYGW